MTAQTRSVTKDWLCHLKYVSPLILIIEGAFGYHHKCAYHISRDHERLNLCSAYKQCRCELLLEDRGELPKIEAKQKLIAEWKKNGEWYRKKKTKI